MTFTPAESEAWKQSQASTSADNFASTSCTHAFLALRLSWVIDSGASAHITRTLSTLSSLTIGLYHSHYYISMKLIHVLFFYVVL